MVLLLQILSLRKYFEGKEDWFASNILVKDNHFEQAKQEKFEEASDLDFWETNYVAFTSEHEDKGQEFVLENEFNSALIIEEEQIYEKDIIFAQNETEIITGDKDRAGLQDDIKKNKNITEIENEEQKGDILIGNPKQEILPNENMLCTKEKRVDDNCLQDADKSCERITGEEKKERSSSSGSIKYILDKGRFQ